MNKESKSEKEQVIEFLLMCLNHWYYFVISMVICTAIAVAYIKIKNPVMGVAAKVSLREDDALVSGSITRSQSLMSSLGMRSGGINVEDETMKLASQGYIKNVIKKMELNKDYTQPKLFGLSKKELYNQSPVVMSADSTVADTLSTIITFKIKINDNKTLVKIKYGKQTIGKYEITAFPTTLETQVGNFTFTKSDYYEQCSKPFSLDILFSSYDFMTQVYRQILDIDYVKKNSGIIDLGINHENVFLAKNILKEIIEAYNNEWKQNKSDVSEKTTAFITNRLDSVKCRLDSVDLGIEKFKSNNNLTDIEADVTYYFTVNAELQGKLLEAKSQLQIVDIIYDYVNDDKNKESMIPFSLTTMDPAIAEVVTAFNAEILEKESFKRGNRVNSGGEALDKRITIQRDNLLKSLDNIKKGLKITETDLSKKEKELNKRIGEIPGVEYQYIALKREQEIQQTIYVFLLEKREEAGISSVSLLPKLKIIDPPYVLNKPVSPNLMKILLLLLFFGGLCIPLSAIYVTPFIKDYIRRKKQT
jgi:uncharacterized protein involved in exopolysaccharide biosynthesis